MINISRDDISFIITVISFIVTCYLGVYSIILSKKINKQSSTEVDKIKNLTTEINNSIKNELIKLYKYILEEHTQLLNNLTNSKYSNSNSNLINEDFTSPKENNFSNSQDKDYVKNIAINKIKELKNNPVHFILLYLILNNGYQSLNSILNDTKKLPLPLDGINIGIKNLLVRELLNGSEGNFKINDEFELYIKKWLYSNSDAINELVNIYKQSSINNNKNVTDEEKRISEKFRF